MAPPRIPASATPPSVVARGSARPLDVEAEIARLDRLATLLDARFRIPLIGWRFGLDGLIGLVPVIGDTVSLAPAAYIVWEARRLGVSRATLGRMAANAGVDYAVGLVPFAGDLFDTAYKANLRNIELIKRDLRARGAPPAR